MLDFNRTELSNEKQYKKYVKSAKHETAFSLIWAPIREYGLFAIPLLVAYLLIYSVVFENGGKENGTSWVYITVGIILTVVTISAYLLRKLIRKNRFEKYANSTVSVYRGNRWVCPLCQNQNNLLAPCRYCGIYPELKKVNKEAPTVPLKGKKRQDYDEYTPQFQIDE